MKWSNPTVQVIIIPFWNESSSAQCFSGTRIDSIIFRLWKQSWMTELASSCYFAFDRSWSATCYELKHLHPEKKGPAIFIMRKLKIRSFSYRIRSSEAPFSADRWRLCVKTLSFQIKFYPMVAVELIGVRWSWSRPELYITKTETSMLSDLGTEWLVFPG